MGNRKVARTKAALRMGKLGHSRLARAVALGILLGGAGALPATVQAAESRWTGATSDEWTDASNWVVPPVNGSFVLIDALDPNAAHLHAAAAVGAVVVGDQGQGELVIDGGGQLEVLGSQPSADPYGSPLGLIVGNGEGSAGTVRVEGSGSRLVTEYNTVIGNAGTAMLLVSKGGTAEFGLHSAFAETTVGFGFYAWGGARGDGHVSVDGAGSSLAYGGGLNVLNGSVDVVDGGQLASVARPEDNGTLWIDVVGFGLPAAGDGSFAELAGDAVVTVSGAGSAWNSVNGLTLGAGGNGTLAVRDGGSASFDGTASLGAASALSADDGSSTGLTRAGTGTLLVESGGTVAVRGSDENGIGLTVGDVAGSTGMVSVSGPGSTLVVDAGAQIGNSTSGSLSVTNGGQASLGLTAAYSETVLGFGYYGWTTSNDQGRGSIAVDGTGSRLTYAGGLNVLNGDVSVTGGGQLSGVDRASDEAFWIDLVGWGVPANPGVGFAGLQGDAYVEVDGEGSAWNSVNALSLGTGGNGTISVRNGGDATFAAYADLGSLSYVYDSPTGGPVEGVPPQAGFGMISVSGAGSTFTLNAAPGAPAWGLGVMTVGDSGGSGYVQVDDGGLLTTAGGIHLGEQGHLTIGGWAEDESPLAAGTVVTPAIRIDAGGSLAFHHDGATTLAAAISGDGWIGATGGHTTLTGDSGAFSGAVAIDDGATMEVTGHLDAGYLDVGYEAAGSLLVSDGGVFHGGAATLGGLAGSSGNVVVSGGGSSFAVDGWTSIGRDGHGSLDVLEGASAYLGMTEWYTETTLGFGEYGWTEHPEQGHGSIVVDGAGSTLDYAGGLNVLNGSLQVSAGGHVDSHARDDAFWVDVLGWGVPADPDPEHGFGGLSGIAFASVSGEGSAWHSVNMLSVGEGGQGRLEVTDGGVASFSGYARLGTISYIYDAPTGSPRLDVPPAIGDGSVFVSGAGSRFDVDALEGVESWQQGNLYVGYSTDSIGDVAIADGASSDIDGQLVVGRRGDGMVSITGGGTVATHGVDDNLMGMILGDAADSFGGIQVSGAGSTLDVDGGAQIGNAGHGALAVIEGATANLGLRTAFAETIVGFGHYGWFDGDGASSSGSILVDGIGSGLNYAGGLNILNGDISVRNGGALSGLTREGEAGFWIDMVGWGVPANPDAGFGGLYGDGFVEVAGEGSSWQSTNALWLGNGGSGVVSINDGADASFLGYVDLGSVSYVYDSPTGGPVEGVPPQAGFGMISVSGAGSTFSLAAFPEEPEWGLGLMTVGVSGGAGYVQVDDGGLLTTAGGIHLGEQGHLAIGGWAEDESPLAAGTVVTPAIRIDAGGSLEFHHDGATTLAAAISGDGWIGATGGHTTLTGDSGAFSGAVAIDDGATMEVTGHLDAGYLDVGYEAAGSLLVSDGGVFHGGAATLGGLAGSSGNVVVSGAGSDFTVDGAIGIGRDGSGLLVVVEGGTASLGLSEWYSETSLGFGEYGWSEHAGQGHGSVLVDGAGSTLDYAGGLNIFNGSLVVSDGGHVDSHVRDDAFWVDVLGWGVPADPDPEHGFGGLSGIAFADVTGEGSAWHSVNMLSVGEGGQGALQVTDGGDASFSGYARLGTISYIYDAPGGSPRLDVPPATGHGSVFVSGAGSSFDVDALEGVESWQQGDLYAGYSEGSTGEVTIADGAGSDIDGRLVAGRRGEGEVSILDGGRMSVHGNDANLMGMVIGEAAGSEGRVVVSGEGAMLAVDGGAQIGNAGLGSLSVLDGGTAEIGLSTPFSEILLGFTYYGWGADADEGYGSLVVDGAGSMLTYGGGLNALNGSVTISDGAVVASQARESDTGWLDLIGFGVAADPVPEHDFAGLYGAGIVTVSGSGSAWNSGNALTIANGGSGLLAVLDGGSASFIGDSYVGTLGYLFDAETRQPVEGVAGQAGMGSILVAGSGSHFTVGAAGAGTGVLHVADGGVGALQVRDGGTATVAGGIEVGANGYVLVGGIEEDGSVSGAGTLDTASITLSDSSAVLAFVHATAGYVFDTSILGNGQVHAAAGFTMLTADSSAFDGYTLVDGGATLSVNGSLGGDLMVATDGRLQGSGTVENLTVAGTLAPGNSPGTLNIAGDLVMQTGAVFEAEIDPATGAYDAIAVTGNVNISEGTVLSVSKLGDAPMTPGISIDLIQTSETTTVEGQFSEVTGGSDFLGYGVDYTGGEINLNVTRSEDVTFESVVGAHFGGVGRTLDGLADDNPLMLLVFNELTSAAEAEQVLADMAGTMHADLRRELVDGSRHLRGALTDRLATSPDSGSGWWAQAMNDQGHMDAEGMWPSVEVQRSGMLVGYDMEVGATRLGAAIGTGTGEYDADGKLANADLRDRHVSVYGSSDLGAMRLGYGLGVSWTGIESERHFAIGDVQQDLMGDRDAHTEQLFLEAARRFGTVEHRFFEPFLSVAHVRVHDGGFEEQGGLAALAVEDDTAAATFGKVGVRWALGGERAQWTGSVGMRYARGFDHGEAEASFVSGGDSFPIRGLGLDGNMLDISMGGRFELSERAHLWAGYESLMGGNSHNEGVKVQFSLDL